MPKGGVMTTVATPPARDSRPTRVRSALWPARYVPWSGRADRLDVVLMGAFLGVVAFGLAIRPLKPFLLASHPELLGLLTGDLIPIGAGAAFARVGDASLWLVVVTGAVGMVKFDWLMWWAGRRWGVGILRMFTTPERAQRAADRATALDPRILRLIVAVSFLPGIPSPSCACHGGYGRDAAPDVPSARSSRRAGHDRPGRRPRVRPRSAGGRRGPDDRQVRNVGHPDPDLFDSLVAHGQAVDHSVPRSRRPWPGRSRPDRPRSSDPRAIIRSTRSRLGALHLLRGRRGLNRSRALCSSCLRCSPSIQPKQSACSTAST